VTIPIRELKRRHRTHLALGQALPPADCAIPLPLSTGNPLFDAALTTKLVPTSTMNEAEHTRRAWHLVRTASEADKELLSKNARLLLTDYKMLLALDAWDRAEPQRVRRLLRSLPWGWRFRFPTAVIKPAAQMFTGWRRRLTFRFVEDPRFVELRELFRETLQQAPGVATLKYRRQIQQSAALLRYRFEGDAEEAIHDLVFRNGREGAATRCQEPIPTYLQARDALNTKGPHGMLDVLDASEAVIPITSYMGLLGNAGIKLQGPTADPAFRDYAVRCATAVESLLRLREWSEWMDERHAETLSTKVKTTVIERGIDIPFF
jgi:hypothetical protein